MKKRHKYIFVVGGVMSGVGKGITTASIGKILMARGLSVNPVKIDPYLNVDAGTMNPIEHGEVFVLDSGLECDQDMGNYERFLDITLPSLNYMTSGMVYRTVIARERALEYGGKCVEAVPHIPQEILKRLEASVKKSKADVTTIEVGGTVGEYQNILFIEAARILKLKNPGDVLFVMVSYLPVPSKLGEMKTKPTQYAIRTLNSYGVHPDIIVARSERPLDARRKEKIAESASINPDHIISAPDIDSIYDVPINFEKDGLSKTLLKLLSLKTKKDSDMRGWHDFVKRAHGVKKEVKIAVIGKYFKTGDFALSDAYISVLESLKHAGAKVGVKVVADWLDSEPYEENPKNLKELDNYAGILIPGGFGGRGIEGKISAIGYAREHKIPYFGLCYGMQLAVIEYSRNVLGIKDANTTEIDQKTKNPVVDIMPEQERNLKLGAYGGSMRLGAWPAVLLEGSRAKLAYGSSTISERHRHRYEINPSYVEALEKAGLVFSGMSPDKRLAEIIELPQKVHPFFLATQFHPEFKSSPLNPHPLFVEFIKAAANFKIAK
ncbi:MAG: CTP synthase [Patescibacteria group bacterium]